MRYLLLLIIGMFFSSTALATATALIPDATKAIIVVQGVDNDAVTIYNNMDVAPTQYESGLLEKKIVSLSGQVSIVCNHSEADNETFCTIKVLEGDTKTYINPYEEVVFINIWGPEGNDLFESFINNLNGQSLLLLTGDQRLVIKGKKGNFSLEYKVSH